jgi:ribonuclease R
MKKHKKKQGHSGSRGGHDAVKGVLEITRSGVGYVVVEDGQGDVLVRPHDFNQAFNGDTVSVSITRDAANGKKREGRIEKVVSRRQTEFIGTLQHGQNRVLFVPDTDKPMPNFELDAPLTEWIDDDQKVVVKLVEWPAKHRRPIGSLVEVLMPDAVNDTAMKEILIEKGFPLAFSDDSLETAARLSEAITEDELGRRRDLRDILTFTIDPVDAKDFDDAISYRKLENGLHEVGVHIADVSHFVEEDTPLDEEAYQRATSVYLPDRVNPMLPERISNELCSLRPHEDKYTFSIVFQLNDAAEVQNHWIGRTVIHSNHRYTYEDAQEIIKGHEGPYKEEMLIINGISQQLRKKRFKNGAINFNSQEVRFKLDEHGKPIGVVIKESFEAHQLIEELMLLANRFIAERVQKAGGDKPIPFPYRIHDTPDEEKLVPFIAFARKFGYKFNLGDPDSVAASFNAMLDAARGTPQQHVLEQLGIRTMAKAVYSPENIGHYGLGFENYCHFTSPIRRYPDVMVHRILQQVLDGEKPNDKKMEKKCKHSSERERAAMECERAANKYKQVEFMSDHLGEEFDAVVTGVSSFGFWAETVEHKCEGLIAIAYLNTYDDFRLVESDYQLVGLRSGRTFRMGDPVRIKVISANLGRRQLDYEWLPVATSNATPNESEPVAKSNKGKANSSKADKKERAQQKSDANRKKQLANNEAGKAKPQVIHEETATAITVAPVAEVPKVDEEIKPVVKKSRSKSLLSDTESDGKGEVAAKPHTVPKKQAKATVKAAKPPAKKQAPAKKAATKTITEAAEKKTVTKKAVAKSAVKKKAAPAKKAAKDISKTK